MSGDPQLLARRAEYVKTVRGLHARERAAGLIGSLVGVLLLIWGRQVVGAPAWATSTGLAVIGVSWALFAYVIFCRTRYVRAHPFDPQS